MHVPGQHGSLTVRGSVIGNTTSDGASPVIISARGQEFPSPGIDLAIGRISSGGRVEFASILAGYATSLNPSNGGQAPPSQRSGGVMPRGALP